MLSLSELSPQRTVLSSAGKGVFTPCDDTPRKISRILSTDYTLYHKRIGVQDRIVTTLIPAGIGANSDYATILSRVGLLQGRPLSWKRTLTGAFLVSVYKPTLQDSYILLCVTSMPVRCAARLMNFSRAAVRCELILSYIDFTVRCSLWHFNLSADV